jgi:hypothetical protein
MRINRFESRSTHCFNCNHFFDTQQSRMAQRILRGAHDDQTAGIPCFQGNSAACPTRIADEWKHGRRREVAMPFIGHRSRDRNFFPTTIIAPPRGIFPRTFPMDNGAERF